MNNQIGAEGAKSIASNFEHLKNLLKFDLNLEYNQIGDEGAKSIGSGFCHLKNLFEFKFNL